MKAPSPTPLIDATPTLARQVIDLYSVELAEVRFPDLDLSALLYAQTQLHEAQLEVERVEAELADKRAELEARSQALLSKAERALAYAKIYVQGDDELAPRLAEMGRKRSGSASVPQTHSSPGLISAPKKRGRKPKSEEAPEELFNEAASA